MKKILNDTYLFTCDKAVTSNPFIQANAINSNLNHNINKILLNNSTIKLQISNLCQFKQIPGTGIYMKCELSSDTPVVWLDCKNVLSVNGFYALTESSYCMCPLFPIAKIEPTNVFNNKLSSSNIVGAVALNSFTSKHIAKTVKDTNSIQSKAIIINSSKTSENSSVPTNSNKSTPEKLYTICEYKNCDKRDTCDYYNTELPLKPANDSKSLRAKYEKNKKIEYDQYYDRENKGNEIIKTRKMSFGNQAHHLISGNQALGMRDNDKYYFGELIKLANYCKYDINNELNCILLPSHYSGTKNNTKQAPQYDVMSIMKAQFHLSHHTYTLNSETLERLIQYSSNYINYMNSSNSSNNFFYNYKYAVKNDLDNLNKKYRKYSCVQNNKQLKQKFIKDMNDVSIKIKRYLDAFENNPKDSFPYFVSRITVEFAFDVPESIKIIAIFNDNNNKIIAKKYRIDKNKNGVEKIVVQLTSHIIDDSTSDKFIKFCDNIQYFLIFNSFNLPFTTTEIPTFIKVNRKINVDSSNIEIYIKDNVNEIINFVDNNETQYQSPAKVVITRLKNLS